MTIFGDGAFKKVTELNEVIGWGPGPIRLVSFSKRRDGHRGVCTEERPCEGTVGRRPRASQGERPQENPTLLLLLS